MLHDSCDLEKSETTGCLQRIVETFARIVCKGFFAQVSTVSKCCLEALKPWLVKMKGCQQGLPGGTETFVRVNEMCETRLEYR
jgi:hypothetical protein